MGPSTRPAHPRALVVDDDESIREVAGAALELVGGWTVVHTGCGESAVELVLTHRPDVVLLDVMMPGMDGVSVRAALAADPRTASVPVIYLTAKGDHGDRSAKACGLIIKPFDPMRLATQVEELLGWDR